MNKLVYIVVPIIVIAVVVISIVKIDGVEPIDSEKLTCTKTTDQSAVKHSENADKVRAVWIYYRELSTDVNDAGDYEKKIDKIFSTISDKKYNVAFVQVRAFADAFYKSEYFPVSKYLCGGNASFDALEIICKVAKKYGIAVHAWINPYRVSYEAEDTAGENMLKTGTGVFYDPANNDAQQLILNGVKELIQNYDISGIHIDDYFYPSDIGETDKASYDEYVKEGGTLPIDSWRRSNVNYLMRHIYEFMKAKNIGLIFSISPSADIGKNYSSYYADVYAWCGNKGYADWIIPQIYFGYNNSSMPFERTLSSWENLIQNDSVKLIVGLAGYKSGKTDQFAGDGQNEFLDSADVIDRQIQDVLGRDTCLGFSVYSYESIRDGKVNA